MITPVAHFLPVASLCVPVCSRVFETYCASCVPTALPVPEHYQVFYLPSPGALPCFLEFVALNYFL
jgi:hypothetical protein